MNLITKLICPPYCVGCGEKLNIFSLKFDDGNVYCRKCYEKWEKAKLSPCRKCGLANQACICRPKLIEDTEVLSLFAFGRIYEADRLVYLLKIKSGKRLFDFAVGEMVWRLETFAKENFVDTKNVIVTHVPRSPKTAALYGFDHAKRLARGISRRLGAEFISAIKCRRGGVAQKKLTAEERLENSKKKFVVAKKVNDRLKDKYVVLVDDVVTSGATAAACTSVLEGCGAREVFVLCLAKGDVTKDLR